MRRAKITIIGAGNVGATTAHWCAAAELGDIVLLDIPQTGDMPKGKGLDLRQAGADRRLRFQHHRHHQLRRHRRQRRRRHHGRHPAQARHEPRRSARHQRQDHDRRVRAGETHQRARDRDRRQQSARRDGAARPASHRLRAAAASSARPAFSTRPATARFLAMELGVSVEGYLRAAHGRPRRHDGADPQLHVASAASPSRSSSTASGSTKSSQRTRNGGAEIVSLLKTGSAYYAPAAATAQMVEAVVRDKKRLIPCAAYCDKEYGVGGYYVGVPVILGASGVERIIELKLTADEQAAFQKSVDAVKQLVAAMAKLV